MRVKLITYEFQACGLSLQLLPESTTEERLLDSFWRFGRLKVGHPGDAKIGDCGYYVQAFVTHPACETTNSRNHATERINTGKDRLDHD